MGHNRIYNESSSETQGQLVGATRILRAKVYNKNGRALSINFTLTERVPEAFEIPLADWGQSASGISNTSGTCSVRVNAQGLSYSSLQLQPDLSVSFLNGLYYWMKAQFIPLGILFGS